MDEEIKYVYGIDLGTTYSCIACIDKDGTPTVLKNVEGDNTTPSVVSFNGDNEYTVGIIAKNNAIIEPDTTVSFVKRLMGKSDTAIGYNGHAYSPAEISSLILKKVADDAAHVTGQEVKDVVITVPAYFGDDERKATKIAGEYAGFNVLAIINEPTAAAICYGIKNNDANSKVLVFDLGGGTFDVSIISVDNGEITELCHDGDDTLGGKDWDDALVLYLKKQFDKETSGSVDVEAEDEQELLLTAEKTKKQLSGRDSVPVPISIGGERAKITVTRDTFDAITKSLLDRTIDVVARAFGIAEKMGVRKSDIDTILLVGGSTKMPQVEKIIIEKYGITPKVFEPDEAVAKGAAIYAYTLYEKGQTSILHDPTNPEDSKPVLRLPPSPNKGSIKINKCTTKSYGIRLHDDDKKPYIYNMIIKNTPMMDGQLSVTEKDFSTMVDNQTGVQISIYESDTMDKIYPDDPELQLNETTMELPSGLKAGEPKISVTFTMTEDGTLDISAKYEKDGKEYTCHLRVERPTGVGESYNEETAELLTGLKRG